ncbi:MAG: SDR family NAD(P)-dependent oxidoreductase [Burkholderiaceae bacterium]|nr:SDR family NAD(P)-dependent oxidoreductase [Burkholderiaceae bacterium]MCD8517577.1 SDR family NAD(P)-dependent oxidoreductase [Burkholderiaceae bacterium]MCD8537371.1 SDR family NAD(P)-dependent oxidoreductase [Burkholderiaceae bacterium]MCD8564589.1 SDR family NAD(P)-dependent oxidoreductase [Burkholderiaceae bacterium]
MEKSLALVTGGSRGIGRAIVERLLADGYEVLNFSRTPPPEILPGEIFESVDLMKADATKQAIDHWVGKREIVHLVNNAGMIEVAALEDVTVQQIDKMVSLNLLAPMLLTQGLIPCMKARQYGRVVNIGSRAALGKVGRSVYSATKAGIVGMTRTWALELAQYGVTVNAIAPGAVATELFLAANPADSEQTKRLKAAVPLNRVGEPAEVAHMVSSLMHPLAGYTTGQVIYVCGGLSVGLAGS